LDEWDTNTSNGDLAASIAVLLRDGVVVQVAYNNESEHGLAVPSLGDLIASDSNLTKVCYEVDMIDDNGEPGAGGYCQLYYDDINGGLAWGLGAQDDFLLTYKPNGLVIHTPGVAVIQPSTKTKRAIIKDMPVYQTQADADRATSTKS
jgi:hypothetical protein